MKIGEIKEFLANFPDDLDIKFIKFPSHKPLAFWHTHEWYVCEQKYRLDGPKDEKFLAILVEDE